MKLAFYYHITLTIKDGIISCPSYLGVFIDSLANEVEELYLIMHQANSKEYKEADYALISKNIHWINLGFKTPVWHRAIFHRRFLQKPIKKISNCETLIVRSPSPLAPYFHKYIDRQKLIFMIVGDYLESVEQWKLRSIREWFELQYLKYNDFLFRRAIRKTDIIVNSPVLFKKYKAFAKSIHQIRTTTISSNDFFNRSDTCQNELIELLFTGRIDPLKGLIELIEAVSILRKGSFNVRLNIVGWEPEESRPVEKDLNNIITKLGVADFVLFHGRKAVGYELNRMYRMADIYVLPSHEEGFPRTIWEAMANSLPVVVTRVGGIPEILKDKVDAVLIEPRSVSEIVQAVELLIQNSDLRVSIIRKAKLLAEENTLELQTKKLISIITNY